MPSYGVFPVPVYATSTQTGTAASGTGVTLTIAAAGAGIFNYLCFLEITMFAAALLTVAATPVLITTTGITNTPTFSMSAPAMVQGNVEERIYSFAIPLKGSAANTVLTIVAPATTNIIWRLNATFYTGA